MAANDTGARAVQLHVIHDLGGGSAKWLRDYGAGDARRVNLVLRSMTHDAFAGSAVALYAGPSDEMPLRVWKFSQPIAATVAAHAEYRAALDEAIAQYGVQALLVSSVIGHSLDVLDTGLPTVVVNHDYFPWCPAINLYFDSVCAKCDGARVAECERDNDRFNPFVGFDAAERVRVRERFVELVRRPNVVMVAPSASVGENLKRLDPRFAGVTFVTIAHGYGAPLERVVYPELAPHDRLRILVLGQLSAAKGLELLRGALPKITQFAEIHLLGCREVGELFKYERHVHVVSDYQMDQLGVHLGHIHPHVGLLMSVVPETFSYTLSELLMLGVPPAATRIGSFPERIRHGENGYLYEPDVDSLVAMLRRIDADRAGLARIRKASEGWKPRTPGEMVADYHRVTPLAAARAAVPAIAAPSAAASATESATLASMWKQVKSMSLQLALVNEARHRTEAARQADAEVRRKLEERLQRFGKEIAEREALVVRRDMELQDLNNQLHNALSRVAELYASTSWKFSAPVRVVGRMVPRVRLLARIAARMLRNPADARATARELGSALRSGGWSALDKAFAGILARETNWNAWLDYQECFAREVRPRIVSQVGAMARKPVISLVVPVYNPPEDMLRQMLESVRGQLYPYWELCLADDASREPWVRTVLQEYAAADRRIKVHYGTQNHGVSHASNRALEMATGDFVVLADHDDILEPQALFRFAQSIVAEDPDMAYSDEVLVTHDRDSVIRYAYRPGFSLEYLRSHPYIVHLTGFRTELLRALGGWDESLTISQDYDLILRAAEKAKRIVHIPEILYRWRVHGASAGLSKQGQVMETSKGVLNRHLGRCGVAGTANDGPSFNLFDIRYPLRAGLKVAIIIPTKNHGALLRQCIESIRATVKEAAYDIVVIDHESDDPATLDYLAAIAPGVQVLRYEGAFNFSAINNWAVAQAGGGYSHYLLCNNDIQAYEEGWLERLLELGQQPGVGMVGAKLFYPDRTTIQHAGVCIGMFGAAEHYGKRISWPSDAVQPGYAELLQLNHEVAAVTAACVLIRRETFEEILGFDESIAVGFGDVDLCLRAGLQGWRTVFCPHARLVHHESFTRGVSQVDPHPADSSLYRIKWKDLLKAGDPYYSPGLSLVSTTWAIRQPLPCQYEIRRRIATLDGAAAREYVTFSAP